MHLAPIDGLIIAIYGVFVLGIGFVLRRQVVDSADFFLAGRSIPAWVAGLAFLSANLGAQEVIGMAASGAKYGILTSHFYWVGAIPAMVFVGVFMMPFYYGSRARSVPEYLKLRFDEKTRGFNAISFAVMTVFSSGISMYAMGALLTLLLGWNIHVSIVVSARRRALLHRARRPDQRHLQRGAAVLPDRVRLRAAGVPRAARRRRLGRARRPRAGHRSRIPGSTWATPSANPMGVEWFGMVMGLGFVLSFGYWCTDFLVVQRAMAAESMNAARRTPLIAAVPKMLFPFLVILPGIIALGLTMHPNAGAAPLLTMTADGTYDYNMALPLMLARYYPSGLLGLGLTALLASFMSGMAGNVTAFNTVWTYDIYQTLHRAGRRATRTTSGWGAWPRCSASRSAWRPRTSRCGSTTSWTCCSWCSASSTRRCSRRSCSACSGGGRRGTARSGGWWRAPRRPRCTTSSRAWSAAGSLLPKLAVLHTYPSDMAQNFWGAIVAWTSCFAITAGVSLMTRPKAAEELVGLVYGLTPRISSGDQPWFTRPATLAVVVLTLTAGAQPAVLVTHMNLDLRLPIGLLFTILGAILVVDGLVVGVQVLGLNVNLLWGAVMVVFGGVMLYLTGKHHASS